MYYCKEITQFQISLPLVNLATLFQVQTRRNVRVTVVQEQQ
jgi:hypothetical protein